MKRSSTHWRKKFRRRMAGCAIGGSVALSSAACYAANAFDNASDPVYADGWQAGDNGGFGFTPWNFDAGYIFAGTNYIYSQAGFKMIDDGLKFGTQFSNPFNDIGRSWAVGTSPGDDGAPHIGRGFSPLQINDTLKVVFDNPTRRQFFKGYFIRLNGGSGGAKGNICNQGNPCSFPTGTPVPKMGWDRFEYGTFGEWYVDDVGPRGTASGVFDTDTAAAGALFQVTRTGSDTYNLLIHQFGAGTDFTASRTFANAGVPIDWIEFVFFNPISDSGTPPTEATDFYIRSMEITAGTPPQWKTDGDGNWSDATNWSGGVPDGPDAVANFLGAITAPRAVTLDSDRVVRSIRFDNSNRYTIGSGGTLIVGQSTQPGSIGVDSGSHVIAANLLLGGTSSIDIANNSALTLSGIFQITFGQTAMKGGKGALIINGPQFHEGGAVLLVNDGRVELNSNAGAPGNANLTVSIGGQQPLVKLGASQDLANLLISFEDAGAQGVDLASTPTAFHSLSIHGGDVDGAKASLSAAINNARTNPGDGIFDSGLHANSGVGIAKLSDAQGPFVLIRPTRIGDLNLDGVVTISDFIDLASHFNGSGTWQEGDLNGDGAVTISDFIDLASNFNTSYVGGSIPISAADMAALNAFAEANGVSLVPEPGALGGFLAAAGVLGRRRRR